MPDYEASPGRTYAGAFCRKYAVPVRDTPGLGPEPELRAHLLAVADHLVDLLKGTFGGGFEVVESELHEIIQIDALDQFNVVAVATALAEIDQAVEVLRCVLGIDGDPVAHEVHLATMRKTRVARTKLGKPDGWQPPDVAGALERQGYKP